MNVPRTSRRQREAGLSLIEILIALFVFMVGVLGIFAVIQLAMDQSARTVRDHRGGILAQYALATLAYELRSTHTLYEGTLAADAGASTLQAAGSPGWVDDRWTDRLFDYHVLITSGSGQGQIRRITSNSGGDTIQLAAAWTTPPTEGSAFRITYYEGNAASAGANTLTVSPSPGWSISPAPQWVGLYVQIISGPGMGQARRITDHTADTLTVSRNWDEAPTVESRFRIVRVAVDARYQAASPRSGNIDTAGTTTLVTDQAGLTFDASTGNLFVLITSGRGAGRVYRLTNIIDGNMLVLDSHANATRDRVADDDDYYILGNNSGGYASYPGNYFGRDQTAANNPQTLADPGNPDYSYAVVVSDTQDTNTGESLSPVRADVFVFRKYNNGLRPCQNRKPVAHRTTYIMPY